MITHYKERNLIANITIGTQKMLKTLSQIILKLDRDIATLNKLTLDNRDITAAMINYQRMYKPSRYI